MCNAQGAVLLLASGCDRRLWVLACAKVLGACTQPLRVDGTLMACTWAGHQGLESLPARKLCENRGRACPMNLYTKMLWCGA